MIKKLRPSGLYFGWWTVIGSGLLSAWSAGFSHYGFAALFKPIATELSLSRAVTSVAASIQRFEGSIEAPLSGWATDRFGPRWVILIGVLLAGLGLGLMYFVNSLWTFYLFWGVLVGAGANLLMLPADTAISNWFVKKRGFALSIKWLITGLSGVAVLPLVAWMITVLGWRTTTLIGGLIVWFIGFPVVSFCLKRHRPEYYGLLPDGAAAKEERVNVEDMLDRGAKYATEVEEVEFTLRQALKTPSFWLLIIAVASHNLVIPVISIHSIPFLTDFGFEPVAAAGMLAMLNLVGLPLRVVGGILADRVTRDQMHFLFSGSYLVQTAGFVFFLSNQILPMIYVWFIVYGIGNGMAYGFQFSIWGRYFGRKAIGSVRGVGVLLTSPISIAAPIWAGWMYDTSGSYSTVFTTAASLLGVSTILMMLARAPKPPERISDIRQLV